MILLLPLLLFAGCTKDFDDELSHLGKWVEEAPVPERTRLFFRSPTNVVRIDSDGNTEEYTYRIEGNTIYLQSEASEVGATPLFFEQINTHTLKIENLYPSIPEDPTSYMIFDRE